jgi:hypothetical protein
MISQVPCLLSWGASRPAGNHRWQAGRLAGEGSVFPLHQLR